VASLADGQPDIFVPLARARSRGAGFYVLRALLSLSLSFSRGWAH